MAFKPISMADSVSFVSTYDPAIDKVRICEEIIDRHDDWKQSQMSSDQMYDLAWVEFQAEFAAKIGRDPENSLSLLKFKDGESPTKFVIGSVPSEDFNRIVDETSESRTHRGKLSERCWRFFLHGIRKVENWSGQVEMRKVGDLDYVDPAWLRRTFIRDLRDVAIQVGQVVLAYNRLTEEEIKN